MQRRSALFLPAPLLAVTLLATIPAWGVEGRIGDSDTVFSAKLVRAYARCDAPNDVARNGLPACNPPVTSVCQFDSQAPLVVLHQTIIRPLAFIGLARVLPGTPPIC